MNKITDGNNLYKKSNFVKFSKNIIRWENKVTKWSRWKYNKEENFTK
jgi:hypothetical protein